MKNLLLLATSIILLVFTACQNDELVNGGDGSEVPVSFSVQVSGGNESVNTRAGGEPQPGDGSKVNRCILEVYLNDVLYTRSIAKVVGKAATFDIRLVTSQTYNFVFWADNVVDNSSDENIKLDNHYNTANGLNNITMTGNYYGSSKDDTRDAFFVSKSMEVNKAFSLNVSLTRPFGQLNIKTTDINDIKSDALKPKGAQLVFAKIYKGFNAVTGEVQGEQTEQAYYATADVVDADGNLTLDYLFAPKDNSKDYPVNMTLSVHKADGSKITDKSLVNIPIRRNYKTNVTGNLMTVGGKFTVTVEPVFSTPDISHEIAEAKSVAEVTNLLKTHANVVLTEEAINSVGSSEPVKVEMPVLAASEDATTPRSVTIPATTKKVVIANATTTESNTAVLKEVTVNVSTASEVEINSEKTTFTATGTSIAQLTATTAENTLIVSSELTITKLILKKGGVRLYGKVSEIQKESGWNSHIYRCVSSQQDVDNLLADNVTGYEQILIDQPVSGTLDFKGTSELIKPMFVSQNVEINNLKLTSGGEGTFNVMGDDLRVKLSNSTITNTEQKIDPSCGIQCIGLNPHLELYGSNVVTTGKSIRGITIGGNANSEVASSPYILLDATSIRANATAIGNAAYDAGQVNAFMGRSYSRDINYYNMTGKHDLIIRNKSSIEGYYYAVNQTFFGGQLIANVTDSYMDGRCAFNVRNSYNEITVSKSVLVGRNYFQGPTEEFGAIVLNRDDDVHMADYTTVNIIDTDIYSRTNPNTDYNRQFSVDARSDYNMINLKGTTKLYELVGESDTPRLPYFVIDRRGTNKCNVDSGVTIANGMEGAVVFGLE